ncbi:flagellar hook assembly protein FlgD [Rhizobium leguminosarum]|uniref:flagellar hook assembly protein FlgD n=1 Tax=Rhizobium leguminosarum TaxID=384 RepID=UPI0013DC2632|nr:flagellar hook assembly protein FlgD [Rhizobium leguminosarum]MBY5316271.1 flagellar hook assembly protein FlgD [Rhizobium leguminosarum]MBY5395735.1 flagellar hook assembly protein FlgD [Rhizobium leguminosarum]NEH50932.1 flagellar hook assembly protein FlgD [Rhizobium leguminosarum]
MAVDATSSVSTSSTTNTTSTAQTKATLNYDNFLQLLIAQMKNQDPTDPMDASEQMSQLASFSQVEQTIQTNTKLDTLLASSSLTQASSYVGKYMESADGTVKGTIESVKVYSDGIIATTTAGGNILVQAGITIADKAPTTSTDTSDT